MIYFVTTASHNYTHKAIEEALPAFRRISYPALFARRSLPRGTYVFSDFDRLSPWQLEVAAGLYRQLAAAGCRVLNDPAKVRQRLALLKRLKRAGFNKFNAWTAEDMDLVDAYPVFIRTQAAHRGVLSDILETPEALGAALDAAVAAGHPQKDLMVVEYCAEPVAEDLFRKLSVYRAGDTMTAAPNVHERHWAAKYGELGVATQELYDEEHRFVVENPFGAQMRKAFDLAGVEYGRVDFGLVGGEPQVYEINTNPMISAASPHPVAIRNETGELAFRQLKAAIAALDTTSAGPAVRIAKPPLMGDRKLVRLVPGYQWMP